MECTPFELRRGTRRGGKKANNGEAGPGPQWPVFLCVVRPLIPFETPISLFHAVKKIKSLEVVEMKRFLSLMLAIFPLAFVLFVSQGVQAKTLLRFMKPTYKTSPPPIVLVAFGTSTKAQVTFDYIDQEVKKAFPGHEIRWAFTSSIIRKKMNRLYEKKGVEKRLKSLLQVLADLEAEGYRKVVVQSLHVFPGEEWVHILNQGEMEGLDISFGEPIFATWEDVNRVLDALEAEIPAPREGCAVLAGHGSPNTYAAPSTAVYLALDRLLSSRFENCFLGSVEGIPSREDALNRAKAYPGKHVRIIPIMLVAGDHVMNDIMGEEPGDEGEPSWAVELRKAGKTVDAPTISIKGSTYYKGLGFYPITVEIIKEHIKQALRDL